jgi:hypothetical protein
MTIKCPYVSVDQVMNELGYKTWSGQEAHKLADAWGMTLINTSTTSVIPTAEWEHVKPAELELRRLGRGAMLIAARKRRKYMASTSWAERRRTLLSRMPDDYEHPSKYIASATEHARNILGYEPGWYSVALGRALKDLGVQPACVSRGYTLYFNADMLEKFPKASDIRDCTKKYKRKLASKACAVTASEKALPAPSQSPPAPPKSQDVPLGTILKLILGKLGKLEEGHKEILKKLEGTSLLAPMDDVVSGVSLEDLVKV